MYRGIFAAAAGSAPGAALFFGTYETMKPMISEMRGRISSSSKNDDSSSRASTHMMSASIGEAAACLVRVPTEVIKSRMQTNAIGSHTLSSTLRSVLSESTTTTGASSFISVVVGGVGGLYRGYGITLMREVPFAMIQFPLYEYLKHEWGKYAGKDVSPYQSAACGSISGGIAAAFTTPLDVIKTRVMLGSDVRGVRYNGIADVIRRLQIEGNGGYTVFFRGIQPRVLWISVGGFVFFGAYESYRSFLLSFSSSSSGS